MPNLLLEGMLANVLVQSMMVLGTIPVRTVCYLWVMIRLGA